MKYIKFVFILLLHFSLVQLAVAQSTTDENGRETGVTATPNVETSNGTSTNNDDFSKGHDLDDPNALPVEKNDSEWVFPNDLDDMQAEMSAVGIISNRDIQNRLIALEEELKMLRQYNELLRLENRSIRQSLGNCCTEVKENMNASDAYLLQNAPNPFNGSADVQFFVPDGAENAMIELRDLKGVLIQSYEISERGMGQITIDAENVTKGTYLYSLLINGELIDSKVMVLTN